MKKKVLVLEDDSVYAGILREGLELASYEVTVVGSGTEGLKHVMNTEFDVVICDMVMPSLPGDMFYLAVEKVRPQLCRRFVFITGHKAEKRWDEFARKRGCLILWKPFELYVLLEAVEVIANRT